jgi:hypothetical protein
MGAIFKKPKKPAGLPAPVANVQERDPARRPTTGGADDDLARQRVAASGKEQRLGDYGSALLTG